MVENICEKFLEIPLIMPPVRRIIAIGDIHGDYSLMIKTLKLGNVIDEDGEWIGGDTVVVQVGDQLDDCRPLNELDRCDMKKNNFGGREKDILHFYTELDRKARKKGGRVISLIGNHEIANIDGDFRLVSQKGFEEFKKFTGPITGIEYDIKTGYEGRDLAFEKGRGEYAKFIGCTRVSFVIIGNFLFVHGGLFKNFLSQIGLTNTREGLIKFNEQIKNWIFGKSNISNEYFKHDSIFYDRYMGNLKSNKSDNDEECKDIKKLLESFEVGHIVIGHTPQFTNNLPLNGTCYINDGQKSLIYRIDTGSSQAFDEIVKKYKIDENLRKPQILEILNNQNVNILS